MLRAMAHLAHARMAFALRWACVVTGDLSSLAYLSHAFEQDMQAFVAANLNKHALPDAVEHPRQMRITTNRAQPAAIVHYCQPL